MKLHHFNDIIGFKIDDFVLLTPPFGLKLVRFFTCNGEEYLNIGFEVYTFPCFTSLPIHAMHLRSYSTSMALHIGSKIVDFVFMTIHFSINFFFLYL